MQLRWFPKKARLIALAAVNVLIWGAVVATLREYGTTPGGIDDANIFMKYARNLAHGEGFVWNIGKRAFYAKRPDAVVMSLCWSDALGDVSMGGQRYDWMKNIENDALFLEYYECGYLSLMSSTRTSLRTGRPDGICSFFLHEFAARQSDRFVSLEPTHESELKKGRSLRRKGYGTNRGSELLSPPFIVPRRPRPDSHARGSRSGRWRETQRPARSAAGRGADSEPSPGG